MGERASVVMSGVRQYTLTTRFPYFNEEDSMLVQDQMSSAPITITADLSVPDALSLMREKKVRRLPVLDAKGKLVGIVSDKDLLYASPSPTTSLSVWEINSLLSRLTVEKVMTRKLVTVTGDTPVEEAARIMADRKIGGLPVLQGTKLVGIITETDIFRALLELLGGRRKGLRATCAIPGTKGSLAKVVSAVSEAGGDMVGLGVAEVKAAGIMQWHVTLKVQDIQKAALTKALKPVVDSVIDIREILNQAPERRAMIHPATGFSIGDPYAIPLSVRPSPAEAREFFDSLILSASGWRGVFGSSDDDMAETLGPAKAWAAASMASVFADFLVGQVPHAPVLALGIDTRPTGPALADVMARVFLASGIVVRYAFICAAPEIMAWTKRSGALPADHPDHIDAFCYISASHNPPGHNGVKFGLSDGGVLPGSDARQLIARLKDASAGSANIDAMAALVRAADPKAVSALYAACTKSLAMTDITRNTIA